MKASEKLLLAVAVVIALFGAFMILGFIALMFNRTSKESTPADVAGLILVGILPVVLGVWLFRRTQNGASARVLEANERTVLHLASKHQGVLTVPQLAEESDMTLEQAKAVLNHLHRKSFNEMTLLDSGEIEYRFQM